MKTGAPVVRTVRGRLAIAVALSSATHVLVLATLRPWSPPPPAPRLLPVSLVSLGGGGGGPRPGEPAPGGEPTAPPRTDPAPPSPASPRPTPTDRRALPAERRPRAPAPRVASRTSQRQPADVPSSVASPVAAAGGEPGAGAGNASGPGFGGGPGGAGTGDGTSGDGSGGARPAYGVNPKPPYPLAARRLGLEGVVLLDVLVRPDGSPAEVNIRESSGHVMLDESARTTVLTRWRFIPARRGDTPIESRVTFPVRFTLREG